MKFIVLTATLFMGISSYGQSEPGKNLPPVKMLPKKAGEAKKIYELPSVQEYKVFNQKGEFIAEGEGQFIDFTEYEKGEYFVKFNGKWENFTKK